MTQEEKSLLLQDLCGRLPYGVKVQVYYEDIAGSRYFDETVWLVDNDEPFHVNDRWIEYVKPYLRSMSSMTEEEERELQSYYPGGFGNQWLDVEEGTIDIFECSPTITLYLYDSQRIIDWLNKKMFDYRGLIPMGLALEARSGMYN